MFCKLLSLFEKGYHFIEIHMCIYTKARLDTCVSRSISDILFRTEEICLIKYYYVL
jgi:hypothetical protein